MHKVGIPARKTELVLMYRTAHNYLEEYSCDAMPVKPALSNLSQAETLVPCQINPFAKTN